ncbi:GDSL esterase/lipase At5g55050-like [Humulus lupulus]|uniref:GDSL esterase/lipase At5g55050-like n=1 Tax=Humulus lupulus TaxID=3486 RepID=UPI002B412511|nr:GDSL esterase/lipase At5g55050-like [Humulus lupulus]
MVGRLSGARTTTPAAAAAATTGPLGPAVGAGPAVPAIYVFGDSTADVGTNNYLRRCGAKANFAHFGIDYPGSKPTGRFSNGYNSVDFLAQFLGFKESPPPYLYFINNDKRNFARNVLNGTNFASGGSGLLDITGNKPYRKVVPFSEQVRQFGTVRKAYKKVLGGVAAEKRLSNSLFLISVGSNDLFEHFIFNYNRSDPKAQQTFINSLLTSYENHLRTLLKLGARRFGVVGLGPIGCCPLLRVKNGNGECFEVVNQYARIFTHGIEDLLRKLSSDKSQHTMKYTIAKAFDLTLTLINDPTPYSCVGFKDAKSACCGGGGKLNAEKPCKPNSMVCEDRKSMLFWDQFHPTEAAYKLAAMALFGGGEHNVEPINIGQLAGLRI